MIFLVHKKCPYKIKQILEMNKKNYKLNLKCRNFVATKNIFNKKKNHPHFINIIK